MLPILVLQCCAVVCLAADLSYSIPEQVPTSSAVAVLTKDAAFMTKYNDSARSNMRFGMLKDSQYFSLGETDGALKVKQKLDREVLCCYEKRNDLCIISLDVTLKARQFLKVLKVQVTINDTNDNDPTFERNVTSFIVSEASLVGSVIATLPSAKDLDSDQYGIDGYYLQSESSTFLVQERMDPIGQKELALILRQRLDRETRDSYKFVVEARDKGNPARSGAILIDLIVQDENDNSPVFLKVLYSTEVPESMQEGVIVATVKATDADVGINGQVRYSLSSRATSKVKEVFEVNEYTGDVRLRGALNREDVDSYLVPIVASDCGSVPKTAYALVNVTVIDVNDNAPELRVTTVPDSGANEVAVLENAQAETFVALLTVADKDAGDNGRVSCYLSTPQFSLRKYHTDEYEVIVSSILDRETEAHKAIIIRCTDSGSPPLTSQTTLNVNIIDVNDNAPIFDRYVYYAPPIQENNAVGLLILRVMASDRDYGVNSDIYYSIGPEHDAAMFAVDKTTGVVTAVAVLDRETQKDYLFTVRATDKGVPPLMTTASVFVRVEDVNDNSPTFSHGSYFLGVPENQPKFTAVGKIGATDVDFGRNGDIWYRLEDESIGPFVIAHDSGVVSTRSMLDREMTSTYQVTVVATDYGHPVRSSSVKVFISVNDENDNEPYITYPSEGNETIEVWHETPLNSTVLTVKAVDLDSGDNGRLGYFIHAGNHNGMFSICRATGELKVAKNLRHETSGIYKLTIGVFDSGIKPHTVFTTVCIQLSMDTVLDGARRGGDAQPLASVEYFNVNLVVVVTLSSLSAVLSIVLVVAIVRIKKKAKENHGDSCRAEVQRLFSQRAATKPTVFRWTAASSSADCHDSSPIDERPDKSSDEQQTFLSTFAPERSSESRNVSVVANERAHQHNMQSNVCIQREPVTPRGSKSRLKRCHDGDPSVPTTDRTDQFLPSQVSWNNARSELAADNRAYCSNAVVPRVHTRNDYKLVNAVDSNYYGAFLEAHAPPTSMRQ